MGVENFIYSAGQRSSGELGNLRLGETATVTGGQVFGAGVDAGLSGPGSLRQDVDTALLARETGQRLEHSLWREVGLDVNSLIDKIGLGYSPDELSMQPYKMSEDDWKKSEYYREGVQYVPGMTNRAAAIYARRKDEENRNAWILDKARGIQDLGFYAGAIGGSIADAKMLTAGVATGLVTAGAGAAIGAGVGAVRGVGLATSAVRVMRGAKAASVANEAMLAASEMGLGARAYVGARIGYGAITEAAGAAKLAERGVEAVVSAIPQVGAGLANAEVSQEKYTMGDAAVDVIAGLGMEAGFFVAGKALRKAFNTHAHPDGIDSVRDVGRAQLASGEKIDVNPLAEAHLAEVGADLTSPPIEYTATTINRAGRRPLVKVSAIVDGVTIVKERATQEEAVAAVQWEAAKRATSAAAELGYGSESIRVLEAARDARKQLDLTTSEDAINARIRKELDNSFEYQTALKREQVAAVQAGTKTAGTFGVEKAMLGDLRVQGEKTAAAQADTAAFHKRRIEEGVRAQIEAEAAPLRERAKAFDVAIRNVQLQEAGKRLPTYVEHQLSPQKAAERSIDPMAKELVDRLAGMPDQKVSEPSLIAQDYGELSQKFSNDPELKAALDSIQSERKLVDAFKNYVECRGGVL